MNKITKEKGLDYFEFHTDLDNPHNLKKLYQHLGLDFIDTDTNGWHFIGIVNPEKKRRCS